MDHKYTALTRKKRKRGTRGKLLADMHRAKLRRQTQRRGSAGSGSRLPESVSFFEVVDHSVLKSLRRGLQVGNCCFVQLLMCTTANSYSRSRSHKNTVDHALQFGNRKVHTPV